MTTDVSIDLTGGLDPAREYVFPECPPEAGMRDAVNMWVSDDRGEVGLPRFAVEALASGLGSPRAPGERGAPRRSRVPAARTARLAPGDRTGRSRVRARHGPARRSAASSRSAPGPPSSTAPRPRRPRRRSSPATPRGPTSICTFTVEATHGRAAVDPGHAVPRGGGDARHLDRGQAHGRPALRAAVPRHRHRARRRRGAPVHRQRAAHPPPGHPRRHRVLGSLLAVGAVPERSRASATSRTRRAPTAASPTTRATSSPATAR